MGDIGCHVCDPPSRAEQRRVRLIDTARKLFIERGFHATGVAQIARESGIAVGQIYRDFQSKEDIVAALVAEDCAAVLGAQALKAAISNGDKKQVLDWLLARIEASSDLDGKRLFAEIVAESARNERIAAIFTTLQDELRVITLAALRELAPSPAVESECALLAEMIFTFSLGLMHHQLMAPSLDAQSLADAMRDILRQRVQQLAAT